MPVGQTFCIQFSDASISDRDVEPFFDPHGLTSRWNAFIPEGEANAAIGYEEFVTKLLPRFGGPDAPEQWSRLMKNIVPTTADGCKPKT